MKNLKLLALFSIAVFALLSFNHFTEVNQIKDGTYDAYYSVSQKREGSSFFGTIDQDKKVIVKVQNSIIIQINQMKYNHALINQPLQFQTNGDATTEISEILPPVGDRDGVSLHTTHKLKIKKEDLTK